MNPEQAKELKQSLLWAEFLKELGKRVDSSLEKLRRCSPEELPRVQERIQTLEGVSRLPDDVIDRES